ncbi:MAG: MgtC/SapB family protein [Lachnospiraceae bacterium]|nr:MgtC/SapB family protein [Lachnospiraceae bacterium]
MTEYVDPIVRLFDVPALSVLSVWSVVFRVFLSLALSAWIGCERSEKRHAAGLRTFMIVSLASTVSMLLDYYHMGNGAVRVPLISTASVIAVAIITVNSILYSARSQIKGLTTSVGLWACSIIGLTVGAGLYTVALIAFVGLLVSLSLFPQFERYLKNRSNHFEVHLELKEVHCLQNFVKTIRELGMTIDDIEANPAYAGSGLSVYTVSITVKSKELKQYKTHTEIIQALASLDYIMFIEEMN